MTSLMLLILAVFDLHAGNLALNQPVLTSSNYSSAFSGNKAVDGITSATSKWTSNGSSGYTWLRVDLGSSQSISSVVVKHAGAAGEWSAFNTSAFRIFVYNNGWVLKSTTTNNTANVTTHNFSANARYVLLWIDDAGIDNYARIPEFEVHGGGCAITLNSSGTSSIGWIFSNSQFTSRTCGTISAGCGTQNWNVTCSSGCSYHIDDDYYADDWIRFRSVSPYDNISCGENVHAPFDGTVLYANRLAYSYGRTVILRSSANNTFAFRVSHLQSIAAGITSGATVSQGQIIGKVGNDAGTSGAVFVCHAHAVLYKNITTGNALTNLMGGHAPSGDIGSQTAATTWAAPYYLDAGCVNKHASAVSEELLQKATLALQNTTKMVLRDLEIFPHPIQESATIRWNQTINAEVNLKLVNLLGQIVLEMNPSQSFQRGTQSLQLQTTQLKSGLYFLQVQSGEEILTRKVTILHH